MIGARIIVNLYQDSRVYLGISPSSRSAHYFAERYRWVALSGFADLLACTITQTIYPPAALHLMKTLGGDRARNSL